MINAGISLGLGRTLYSPSRRASIINLSPRGIRKPINTMADLSPRRFQMVKLLCRGFANKEIAAEMGIRLGTVKAYLFDLYTDLKVANRTEAVLWVYRQRFGELTWE